MVQLIALLAAGFLLLLLGYTLYAVNMLPDLQPWHTVRLDGEYSAIRNAGMDFPGYQRLETRLFAAAEAEARTWTGLGEAFEFSRFNPAGTSARIGGGSRYNRSFRLTPARPRGGALLVHGLTDSPYSMKALAESLHRRGFEVTVLRLPGHGTFPSMLTEVHYRDWVAAVRLAARDVATRTGPGQPMYVGGYSTGATLTLTYALDALADPDLRRPDRVLLLSPAVELAPVAALANMIDMLSLIPLSQLEKVRWQDVLPEYDPYKFNSFPINAARQVNRATSDLAAALMRARDSDRLAGLPPVVTWQSAVDSTVGSGGTVDRLYSQLADRRHRLVIFDVNYHRMLSAVQRPAARAVIDRAIENRRGHVLEVVSNAADGSAPILARYASEASAPVIEPLPIAWPADVVSLGHVALPFRPDDPVYGILPGSRQDGMPTLGSLLLRGENGALTVSLGSLTRLRSNPFWGVIEQQVDGIVEEDLSSRL